MRVAIIGSGPSGFYAAEALLKQADREIHVDMFDRLPTPFGLVRIGVAPDHQSIKTIARVYEKTAARPHFRFMGNVCLGRDVTVKDLRRHYHQIIYAIGNEDDRRLGIPGEGIARSTPASVFIGWYNGHPDYKDAKIDLSVSRIAVVGHGNVALDVARILLHDPAELEKTDITAHALDALRRSNVNEIFVLGRRGPEDATFTPSELRAFGEMENIEIIIEPGALADCTIPETDGITQQEKNLQIFQSFSKRQYAGKAKKLHLQFWVSPYEVIADSAGKVTALALEKNRSEIDPDGSVKTLGTGETQILEVGMMLSAIGYAARRIDGIPYDENKKIIANENGRVVDPVNRKVIPHEYVVGWARSGPQGLIGSHKGASARVVDLMLADAAGIEERELPNREAITAMLHDRGVQTVSFDEWKQLDDVEIARGALRGAPRDKIADVDAMLTVLAMQ
jgi:ferredoxin--NADP+ reductase